MTFKLLRPLYDDWGQGQEGQIVEIDDPEKAEALEARGLIARAKMMPAPENKMLPPPENQASAAVEVAAKPKRPRRFAFGTGK